MSDFRHRTSLTLGELDIQRINLAQLILRRVGGMNRMPTISETISWLLTTSPLEELWDDAIKSGVSREAKEETFSERGLVSPAQSLVDSIARRALPEMSQDSRP